LRISAIIPTYERPQATLAALRSVLAQTAPPFEVIVVDDHSSVPFALPLDLETPIPVRIVRLDANGGPAAARNAGIAAASGDWIAFLDSDDSWTPGKLAGQIAFAGNSPTDTLACHATGFARVDALKGNRREELIPVSAAGVDAFAGGCWFAPGSTAILHRKAFDIVGGFDASLRRLEDLDWFIRFALLDGKLQVAPFVGAVLNVGGRPDPAKVEAAGAAILAKWSGSAGEELGGRARARLAAYLDLECASANFYGGGRLRAAMFLARSVARAPRRRLPLERWWRGVGA
jgi:glycosyltransferase involved in cell wall biosynthesis